MTGNILELWLNGQHLGQIEQLRNRDLRVRFSDETITANGVGSRVLSLALPITTRRVQGVALERFVEGLLPEGRVRAALEREHNVRPNDSFGLLRAIGQECAGAIQFTAEGQEPGPGHLRAMSDIEVAELVRNLPTLTPPDGLPVTASLGGVQSKVLLARTADGWAWPADGAQSTHIIKPEPTTDVVVAHLIESEDWALRLARSIGITTASAELADFDGRKAIVVKRYDRAYGRRMHQEDFTQALGVATSDKYESALSARRGRLHAIATVGADFAIDPTRFREALLKAVAFNAIIGNGDAHSKNYSLTISSTGDFDIAPLYDSAPVYLLSASISHSGHALDGQVDLKYITADHLVNEAVSWGMRGSEATDVVAGIAESVATTAPTLGITESLQTLPALVGRRAATFVAGISKRPR